MATLAEFIRQTRALLQDTQEPFRYSSVDIVAYVNNSLNQARRYRPDLFRSYVGQPLPVMDLAELTAVIPIDDMYFSPLIDYVAGDCSARDDEFVTGERYNQLMTRFLSALTLQPG